VKYPKGIFHKSNGTMKRKICNLTDSGSDEDEMIAQLKETFHIARKESEKVQILTSGKSNKSSKPQITWFRLLRK
jgi:hypothetical protein